MAVAVVHSPLSNLQGPLGLIAPPEIAIECDAFTGTLGTLVKCVMQHKVDLWDIPMFPICQAYLGYLRESHGSDLDGASSALVAMAYLLERKAERLLPVPEPEEDFEEDIYDGPEIIDFQAALRGLEQRFEDRENLFFRTKGAPIYELPFEVGNVTVSDLARTLEMLLSRAVTTEDVVLSRPRRSLADQMKYVLGLLTYELRTILEIIPEPYSRQEALWTFLALLEMIRLHEVNVEIAENGEIRFAREVIEG